jgi:hypothetical protein
MVERAAGGTSLVDVLDRVLDKGIVIDACAGVSLVGIDLITVDARIIVVASIDTDLRHSSRSMLRKRKGDEDDDDGGQGSSGAPAILQTAPEPRRRPGSRPKRTRRKPH